MSYCCRRLLLIAALIPLLAMASIVASGAEARKIAVVDAPSNISCIAIRKRFKELATGHTDGSVHWWNFEGKEVGAPWPKLSSPIVAMSINFLDTHLVVACRNSEVQVFNLQSKKLEASTICKGPVTRVAQGAFFHTVTIAADEIELLNFRSSEVLLKRKYKGPLTTLTHIDRGAYAFYGGPKEQNILPPTGNKANELFMGKKFTDQPRIFGNLSLSDNAMVSMAAFDRGMLIPFRSATIHSPHHTRVSGMDKFDVQSSFDGRYAICLGREHQKPNTPAIVWDMVNESEAGRIEGLPASIREFAFNGKECVLAVRGDDRSVEIWNLKELLPSKEPPEALLNGKLSIAIEKPYVAQPKPKADPNAPVVSSKMEITKFAIPEGPLYMEGSWRLKPVNQDGSFVAVDAKVEGLYYYVMSPPEAQDPHSRMPKVLQRILLRSKDRWYDCGPCPWKAGSRLMCRMESPSDPHKMTLLNTVRAGEELYFVPGQPYLTEQAFKLFPPSTQEQILTQKIRWLVLEKEFGQIETLASKFHESKAMFGFATPMMGAIYNGFLVPEVDSRPSRIEYLDLYEKDHPKSPFVHVARAHVLIDEAWRERGSKTEPLVINKNQAEFAALMSAARESLAKSPLGADDPYMASAKLALCVTAPLTSDSVIEAAMAGCQTEYTTLDLIDTASLYLMRRWSNDATGHAKFAERLKKKFPGDVGEALACRVYRGSINLEPERWQVACGMDAGQLDRPLEAMRRLKPDDHITLTCCTVAKIADSPDDAIRKSLWRSLGLTMELPGWETFSQLAEWDDAIEEVKYPTLSWRAFGIVPGQAAFSPDTGRVVAVNRGGGIRNFDMKTGKPGAMTPFATSQHLSDIAVGKGGETTVFAGLEIFKIVDGKSSAKTIPDLSGVVQGALSPDGRRLLCVKNFFDALLTDISTTGLKTIAQVPNSVRYSTEWTTPLATSPDGRRGAVAIAANEVAILDLANGRNLGTIREKEGVVLHLAFHTGSSRLVVATTKNITEYDVAKRTSLFSQPSPFTSHFGSLQIAAGGKQWALVREFGMIQAQAEILVLNRSQPGAKWKSLPGIRSNSKIAWHPTEPKLVVFGDSGMLSMYDLANGIP